LPGVQVFTRKQQIQIEIKENRKYSRIGILKNPIEREQK